MMSLRVCKAYEIWPVETVGANGGNMLSVREKITRRMINLTNARDPFAAAIALEGGVGAPESANVVLSRQRLRGLLAQAVSLGIEQQRVARREQAARDAAKVPPPWMRRGLCRLWLVSLAVLVVFVYARFYDDVVSTCYRWPKLSDCRYGGWPEILERTAIATLAAAGVSWLAYQAVIWVIRGFHRDQAEVPARSGSRWSFAKVARWVAWGVVYLCGLAVIFGKTGTDTWLSALLASLWSAGFPLGTWAWREEQRYAHIEQELAAMTEAEHKAYRAGEFRKILSAVTHDPRQF
jgi:hypothetical protein